MYRIFECIRDAHDYGLVAVAALVCVVGSCLSVMILRRLLTATGQRRRVQLFLASLITGATVWSTHFIAMLAYQPGVEHGYEPILTAVSLIVAVLGMLCTNTVFIYSTNTRSYLTGGACFGVTVGLIHYVGMSAYMLPGYIVWDLTMVLASIGFGMALGAHAFHRIAYPNTRYCWLGGAVLMVLSICMMHFTSMAAITVRIDPLYVVPPKIIPDAMLGMMIFTVTFLILVVGFASISIETNLERETLEKLQHTATHDQLTGLPNRLFLNKVIAAYEAEMAENIKLQVAVLTLDFDRFKEINALYGHPVGDYALTETARRLSEACGKDEFVARTGGDEFVALKKNYRRPEAVRAFAERLHTMMVEPLAINGTSLVIRSSIGIATSSKESADINNLLRKSDMAMHRAKAESDQHICFYDAAMDEKDRDRRLLVNDLQLALGHDQFELAYQLQNDLSGLDPIGFEVLLRWNHPTRGRVSPAEFIPLAEETGLIREIGLWVLRTACVEAAKWAQPFSVAVNVAPQQLAQPSFLTQLSDILVESGLAPERLELEVTEASIIDDQEYTMKVMHQIRDMGVRIAMDDFGTGYSSLATLQAFPFDKIKIDRAFVQDVHVNHQRAAIVRSTLLLGEALGIPVLAEGVEEEAELAFLQAEKCAFVQGFYFGKPMSLGQIQDIVSATPLEEAS